MKSSILFALCCSLLVFSFVKADCDEKKDGDGEVLTWFKNVGCKIQTGAADLGEQAKPWADKVGTAAKDLGHTISEKYNDLKHKISDNSDENIKVTQAAPLANAPTEKVPLAPLDKEVPADLLKNVQ